MNCSSSLTEQKSTQHSTQMSDDVFVSLMSQFYYMGWMKGTGGAMGAINAEGDLLVSPSALQKERLTCSDVFVIDKVSKNVIRGPNEVQPSSCQILFEAIIEKTGFPCVIHTHSKSANLITQLYQDKDRFEISNQEYIKGIYSPLLKKCLGYTDTLKVPIVDNMPSESQLLPALLRVLEECPDATAMLVRNHGLFVWGPSWQMTKTMTECYDYLFELAVEMVRLGIKVE